VAKEGKLMLVSADGFRLAVVTLGYDETEGQALINANELKPIINALIDLTIGNGKIVMANPDDKGQAEPTEPEITEPVAEKPKGKRSREPVTAE